MKKILFYLSSLVLLSSCTFSVNEKGITAVGDGSSIHINPGVVVAWVLGIGAFIAIMLIIIVAVMKKQSKDKKEELDKKLKKGEITKEEYQIEIEKIKKWLGK